MTIGQMTARTGVAPRLLRYYEDRNLIVPGRDRNGYRMYCELGVQRVEQIRSLLRAGLSTKTIGALLPRLSGSDITDPAGDSRDFLAALCDEVTSLQRRITELRVRREALTRYAEQVAARSGSPG